MIKNFWTFITKVPRAKNEIEKIKLSVLRAIVFSFGSVVFIFTIAIRLTRLGQPMTPMTGVWLLSAVMFWSVWFLLGTRFYKFALMPWAIGYAFNACFLIPQIATEAIVYRVQIYLLLTLLIFSIYLKRTLLYSLAVAYYVILLAAIYVAGVLTLPFGLGFTLACVFAIAAMELLNRIRESEAKLIEQERARALHSSRLSTLGETTAFIVHEVASPLTIIGAHLDLIKSGDNTAYHLAKMQNAVDRATEFITSVKKMVRSSDQNGFEKIQLSEILKMASDLVEPNLRRKTISLEFDFSDDIELICMPAEITQVLINLINNSADAINSQKERWVRISCRQDRNFIDFEVSDPGAGIESSLAKKIMDPFFSTKETGSGIGLAIAQQVAEHHDGKVEIVSFKNPTVIRLRIAIVPSLARTTNEEKII